MERKEDVEINDLVGAGKGINLVYRFCQRPKIQQRGSSGFQQREARVKAQRQQEGRRAPELNKCSANQSASCEEEA